MRVAYERRKTIFAWLKWRHGSPAQSVCTELTTTTTTTTTNENDCNRFAIWHRSRRRCWTNIKFLHSTYITACSDTRHNRFAGPIWKWPYRIDFTYERAIANTMRMWLKVKELCVRARENWKNSWNQNSTKWLFKFKSNICGCDVCAQLVNVSKPV